MSVFESWGLYNGFMEEDTLSEEDLRLIELIKQKGLEDFIK